MGGLEVMRRRIEGNIKKIKAEHERPVKKKKEKEPVIDIEAKLAKIVKLSPSTPPAPFMVKRKRRVLVDEEEENVPRRKLSDEFEKVAEECGIKKEFVEGF